MLGVSPCLSDVPCGQGGVECARWLYAEPTPKRFLIQTQRVGV